MYRFAFCGYDETFSRSFRHHFTQWKKQQPQNIKANFFSCYDEFLQEVECQGQYQVVFLDIDMPEHNGFDDYFHENIGNHQHRGLYDCSYSLTVAAEIERHCPGTMIVIISAFLLPRDFNDYIHPYHCFTKNDCFGLLSSVLDSVLFKINLRYHNFCFCVNKVKLVVSLNDVIYFYSAGRKVFIVCTEHEYSFNNKLDIIDAQISDGIDYFLRIHKSYIINKRYLRSYKCDCVEMSNHDQLQISRSHQKDVKCVLDNYQPGVHMMEEM
ncbi:MAG: response regulator transcription factor [Lachnospiraceae bacterium]|jgi:CheY-like chemotaxis protein|nr:response regulator transcription factor [Lachnospiraceae bacterium]